jgi:hypothetical protein
VIGTLGLDVGDTFAASDLNAQGCPPLQGRRIERRNWEAKHMNVQEQIKKYITSQPEPKGSDMRELHRLTLHVSPECKLWFFVGLREQRGPRKVVEEDRRP